MTDPSALIKRVESLSPCERKLWDLRESQSDHYDGWHASSDPALPNSRAYWKARALAAEAALEKAREEERERCAQVADRAAKAAEMIYPEGEARGVSRATADGITEIIRAKEPK